MDSLEITDLRATSRGVPGQVGFTYVVSATMYLDLHAAARTDDLAQTVDYVQITRRIITLIEGLEECLVESVASRVADAILLSHQVQRVKVHVRRLNPMSSNDGDVVSVGVSMERESSNESGVSPASVVAGMSYEYTNTHSDASLRKQTREEEPAPAVVSPEYNRHRAVIAVSGNVGNVRDAMRTAVVSLDGVPGSQILGISPLYTSTDREGAESLCAVLTLETRLEPIDIYSALKMVELAHGHSPGVDLPSTPLDLVLIDVDDREWTGEELSAQMRAPQWIGTTQGDIQLPHRQAWQKAEILKPWLDIEPDAHLCGPHGGAVSELLQMAPNIDDVQLLSDSWILGGSV